MRVAFCVIAEAPLPAVVVTVTVAVPFGVPGLVFWLTRLLADPHPLRVAAETSPTSSTATSTAGRAGGGERSKRGRQGRLPMRSFQPAQGPKERPERDWPMLPEESWSG